MIQDPRIVDTIIDAVAERIVAAAEIDYDGDPADARAWVLDRVTHADVERFFESHLEVSAKAVDRAQLQACLDVLRAIGKFS